VKEVHPFHLLASAIAERPVYIAYLTKAGSKAHTDGEHIYIPVDAPREVQRTQIIVHSALIAAGSLQPNVLTSLLGRIDLQQRYLGIEIARICLQMADRLPEVVLAQLRPFCVGVVSDSCDESLVLAKQGAGVATMPSWVGTLYPFKLLRNRSSHELRAVSNDELTELEAQLRDLEKKLDDPDGEEAKKKDFFWQLFSSPLGRNNLLSKLLKELLDMSSSPESGDQHSAGTSVETVAGRTVHRLKDAVNALKSAKDLVLPSAFLLPEAGAHSYQEWDFASESYKPNWVNVEEVEPYSDAPVLEHLVLSASNSRYQQAMAGLCFNYEPHKNQLQGDDLVLDSLVDLVVTTRSGHSGNDRIYRANLRTRRDLAVEILLDVSSSTLDGPSGQKQVCELQAEAAWQLSRAFSMLGDRVALHGFHSWGRKLVRFQRLKSFDDLMGATVERRLRNVSVAGYTRYGAAIRHAGAQLKQYSGMPSQLLLIISDGYPYDDQYEGKYAEEDTRKALEEVRAEGIATVCLSIGSDVGNKKLEKIYGATNYLALDSLDKIPVELRPVIEIAFSGLPSGRSFRRRA
jgi:nitric oxide reductase NorD protein